MVVSVTIVGEADESCIIYRSGAQAGDYLCVTGHLGASVAGLKVLQRGKNEYLTSSNQQEFTPHFEPYTHAIERHLMPKPRTDIVRIIQNEVKVHAMIDISDGLASEVHHLCDSSDVGALVYEHNIPVDVVTQKIAAEFSVSPVEYALYGGEEYELLFSLSKEEYDKLEQITADVTIIGRITEKEKGIVLVCEQGEQEPLHAGGWNHFRK